MFVADNTSGFGFFQNFGKTRRQGGGGCIGALRRVRCGCELHVPRRDLSFERGSARRRQQHERGGRRASRAPRRAFGRAHSAHAAPYLQGTFATWRIVPQLTANVDVITICGQLARGNENNEHEPDGVFYLGPGRTGRLHRCEPRPELRAGAAAHRCSRRSTTCSTASTTRRRSSARRVQRGRQLRRAAVRRPDRRWRTAAARLDVLRAGRAALVSGWRPLLVRQAGACQGAAIGGEAPAAGGVVGVAGFTRRGRRRWKPRGVDHRRAVASFK